MGAKTKFILTDKQAIFLDTALKYWYGVSGANELMRSFNVTRVVLDKEFYYEVQKVYLNNVREWYIKNK